jgi:hypothetical protein
MKDNRLSIRMTTKMLEQARKHAGPASAEISRVTRL